MPGRSGCERWAGGSGRREGIEFMERHCEVRNNEHKHWMGHGRMNRGKIGTPKKWQS